jgi:hypothetical protein
MYYHKRKIIPCKLWSLSGLGKDHHCIFHGLTVSDYYSEVAAKYYQPVTVSQGETQIDSPPLGSGLALNRLPKKTAHPQQADPS